MGRSPTTTPLPEGYISVVVRSEHVSRAHWSLTIDGRTATIRDLDSKTGTSITAGPDNFPLVVPSDVDTTLGTHTVVTFGDRSATITRRRAAG